MTLGLGNITALLERVGNPERRMRTVVVAGTNGKGSVTAMLAGILAGDGVCTGRFTSPHVYSVAERISVNGSPVGIDALGAVWRWLCWRRGSGDASTPPISPRRM
jgi:dihydrofolate synthase/folylpolyglutamate synthase